MPLLYHAYVYLEFLILACTIYILAPVLFPFVTENAITGIDEEINIALIATPTITFFALISFTSFDRLYFYLYFIK